MKNTINSLGWIAVIVFLVCSFLLFWQIQQNEHAERMVDKAIEQRKQSQTIVLDDAGAKSSKTNWFTIVLRTAAKYISTALAKIFLG